MSDQENPEWYYVGHYGQLGPLTLGQMGDLIEDGVIDGETYVWRTGMGDWLQAGTVSEMVAKLRPSGPPPGPSGNSESAPPVFNPGGQSSPVAPNLTDTNPPYAMRTYSHSTTVMAYGSVPKSDKSRVAGGLLNLLPGIGRFYLGYSAHGIMQLLTTVFCGVGLLWSWIDGLYILLGGVKYDGYGRGLED